MTQASLFKTLPSFLAILVVLMFSACRASPSESGLSGKVEMGPRQAFKGVLSTSFEQSAFSYCLDGFNNCSSIREERGCWLQFSQRASIGTEEFFNENRDWHRFYLEFNGRESLKRGGYGHLGEYSCLVEVEKLTLVKPIDDTPPEEEK